MAEYPAKIVIVDDDATNLRVFEAIVRKAGFQPAGTERAEQAIEWCSRACEAVPLLILDVQMPGISGIEIARRVAQVQADARFLFVSGTPFARWAQPDLEAVRSLVPGFWCVLPKPFQAQSLMQCLSCLLSSRDQYTQCVKHRIDDTPTPSAVLRANQSPA